MVVEARADEHDHNARAGLSAFDPATGRVRDLAALADKGAGVTFWNVSPDGTTVAFGAVRLGRRGSGKRCCALRPAKSGSSS